jgi:hypothetical protein
MSYESSYDTDISGDTTAETSRDWDLGRALLVQNSKRCRASDLPIEQPTRFDFVITLQVAKADWARRLDRRCVDFVSVRHRQINDRLLFRNQRCDFDVRGRRIVNHHFALGVLLGANIFFGAQFTATTRASKSGHHPIGPCSRRSNIQAGLIRTTRMSTRREAPPHSGTRPRLLIYRYGSAGRQPGFDSFSKSTFRAVDA